MSHHLEESLTPWVATVPSHWRVRRLGVVADIVLSNVDKHTLEGEIPIRLCNYTDVYKNDRITAGIEFMRASALPREIEKFQVREDDVLATKDSEEPNDIAVSALIAEELPGVLCGYHLALIRANRGKLCGPFLAWVQASKQIRAQYEAQAVGVTRFALGQSAFKEARVPLPPPAEQRRIVAYLDEVTAKIDRLMDLRRRQMELLREQRAALIQQTVTRGLNPRAPLKDSGNPYLPEIPTTWSSAKLKYLGRVISGFAFDSADFTDAGIRVLKIANIQTMRLDWSDESFVPTSFYERHSQFAVADGDLVFALTRPIISTGLKAAIADLQGERVLLNQRNAVFKPNTHIKREFLYYAVFSRYFVADFESRIDATGQQPNISPVAVADIPIALPSMPEQRAIVQFIQCETAKLDKLHKSYARQLELLSEYRAALIHECVTGQRAVPN